LSFSYIAYVIFFIVAPIKKWFNHVCVPIMELFIHNMLYIIL